MTRHAQLAGAALVLAFASTAVAQPEPAADQRVTLDSKVLGEQRVLLVRTPPGYETGEGRYPVLYLTDGDAQLFHTASTIQFLARNGRMPEMIVVGITNTDRTRDLTPTRARLDGRDFPTAGGADNFLRFIETEVVPYVERTYRTEPFRMFAGHSFGGLFALHAFYTKPDLFGAVVAVSPTFTWDNDLPVRKTKEFLASRTDLKRTLVVTLGDEGPDAQRGFDALKAVLEKTRPSGFEWNAVQFSDEDHGSVVLPSHYAAFRKVFEGWRLPTDRVTGAYTGTLTDVESHYRKVSDRLGYRVTPPEAAINQLGYGALARGQVPQALEYFEFNVRTYPASPNVYDSLGEGLEAAGRLEDALKNYEKAVSMGEQAHDPLLDAFRQHVTAARTKLGKRPS